MHVQKLLQTGLASRVHAHHLGFQGCFPLCIGFVAQMLKVGGGEETILVGQGARQALRADRRKRGFGDSGRPAALAGV